jgi:leader peptidase (prepilin peptidase)/N-methyltransferase
MEVGAMYWAMAPVYAYVALLSAVLITSDLRHRTLPNTWTLSAYPILIVLLMIPTAYASDWWQLGRAILGALVTVLTLYLLAVLSKDGMGMGDVKLAGALALVLAWQSWMSLFLAMAGAFMLSAVFGLILLALRRASRRSELPFGPFLIAATWLVIILN